MKRPVTKEIGLSNEDLILFKNIGEFVDAKYVIARGSRVKGYWIDSSDYDIVTGLPFTDYQKVKEKIKELEKELKIKIDFICSDKVFPTDGIMLKIK